MTTTVFEADLSPLLKTAGPERARAVADPFGTLHRAVTGDFAEPFPPLPAIEAPAVNVAILALDLGTKPGYAVRRRDGRIVHGSADFTPRRNWAPGQKWKRFRSWLSDLIVQNNVQQIAFEDVKRHALGAVLAAHAYGGFRAHMEDVAESHGCTLHPYGVGHIKQHWTGNGAASKDEMVAQTKARGFRPADDNDADAVATLHLALADEAGTWSEAIARAQAKDKARERAKVKRASKGQGKLL